MCLRKSLIIVFLSASYVIFPSAALAGPVAAFVGGVLNALGASTWLASGFVGAWSAGYAVGGFLGGTVLGRLVLSTGIDAVVKSFSPKSRSASPSDRMVNYAQDVSFQERGYGRVKKGGALSLSAFRDGRRHYGVIIAAHSTKGPVAHYLDKLEVQVAPNGVVLTEPIARWSGDVSALFPSILSGGEGTEGNLESYGSIRTYTGKVGQEVDPILLSAFGEITEADDFKGLSHAVLYAEKPRDSDFIEVYPSSVQWAYLPVWDMHDQVFDPRDNEYKFTQNGALIIAAEALYFGKEVDWDEVAQQANIADQILINGSGGSQPRWTVNAVFDDSMTWEQVRSQLSLATDAWFYERADGKVGFKLGQDWVEPEVTLTDADLYSISLSELEWGPDVAGSFVTEYIEPSRGYTETPSGAYVIDENGPRRTDQAYLVDSHNQAWRVSVSMARRMRPQYQVQAKVKFIGLSLMGKRFVRIRSEQLELDAYFEVSRLVHGDDSKSFSLSCFSVVPESMAPDALLHEPPRSTYSGLASEDTVGAPSGLYGEAVEGTGGAALIDWRWPVQDISLRPEIRIRCLSVSSEWQTVSLESGAVSFVASGLVDGAIYEAQIRNRTGANRVSEFAPTVPLSVRAVANTEAPPALEDLLFSASGADVLLSWFVPNGAVYAAARIYRSSGTDNFEDASLIHTEYGVSGFADQFTDSGLSIGGYAYWIEPVNASGVGGPVSFFGEITII